MSVAFALSSSTASCGLRNLKTFKIKEVPYQKQQVCGTRGGKNRAGQVFMIDTSGVAASAHQPDAMTDIVDVKKKQELGFQNDRCPFIPAEPSPTGSSDSEFRFPNMNRLESGASFSDSSRVSSSPSENSSSPVEVEEVKKKKHNLVEQNRRETTRAMISDLKDMVGADGGTAQHPNINKVLEGTLAYLKRNASVATTKSTKTSDLHPSLKPDAQSLPFPDRDLGRYLSGFDGAPFGIICAKSDGVITRVNDRLETMFGLPKGFAQGKIMFALCADYHMPMAMGAANSLLTGQSVTVQLVKDCVGSSGKPYPYLCQYSCIWKEDKPVGIVVYIRPETQPSAVNFVK